VLSASGAWGVGANFGAIVKANERLRFGVRYLTHIELHYSGTATFTPVAGTFRVTKPNPLGLPVGTPLNTFVAAAQAALQSQPASTDIDMPAQLVVGTSVGATDRLTLFADYQWVQWSAFDTVVLNFSTGVPPSNVLPQNFHSTNTIRLGAQYDIGPMWRVSGGYIHNQAAAPDESVTPFLPDAARNHLTAGYAANDRVEQRRVPLARRSRRPYRQLPSVIQFTVVVSPVGADGPREATTRSVMLCGDSVRAILEAVIVTSAARVIAFADVNCHTCAVPRSAKWATLIVASVVPESTLLTTMIVNDPSVERCAAKAASEFGSGTVAVTLVSPNAERLPS
jgi:Outer membrane protein transport protein (OMPP1/FadL/TodX)